LYRFSHNGQNGEKIIAVSAFSVVDLKKKGAIDDGEAKTMAGLGEAEDPEGRPTKRRLDIGGLSAARN